MKKHILTLVGLAFAGMALASSARSADIVWKFNNFTDKTIDINIYHGSEADNRWPSDDRVYFVEPYGEKNFNIMGAEDGERICFGANAEEDSTSWGVGRNNTKDCEGCCFDADDGDYYKTKIQSDGEFENYR